MCRKLVCQSNLLVSLLLGFLMLSFPSASSADVLMEGYKQVEYAIQIINTNDFPDYVFLLYLQEPKPIGWGGYYILNQDKADSYYWPNPNMCHPKIYAIKKTKFRENDISNVSAEDGEKRIKDGFSTSEEDARQIADYFENNKALIPSTIRIKQVTTVKEVDPTNKVIDIFKIDAVANGELKISPIENPAENNESYTQSKDSTINNRKDRVKEKSLEAILRVVWYPLLPILAFLVIIGVVIYRSRQKGPH